MMSDLAIVNEKIRKTKIRIDKAHTEGGRQHYIKFLGFLKYLKKQLRRS